MSKISDLNSRQKLFPVKVLACFFGLLAAFFVFSPVASMQDGELPPMNMNAMAMNGNYRPTPEPPKSTIRGRVIYSDTGRAVRRAGLILFPTKGGAGGRESGGVTNERGEFEIRDVAEGRYFVSVNAPGVLTPLSALSKFDSPPLSGSEELADIIKDYQEIVVNGITDVDVTVTAQRGAAVSGRIGYADGDPAIGVRVEILRKKEGRYSGVISNLSDVFGAMFGGGTSGLKTDDRGVFRVAGLPAGEYVVRVLENVAHTEQKSGRGDEMMMLTGMNPGSMVSTYFPNTSDVKKAEVVKIELGQEYAEINITIPERSFRTLKGIVVGKATRQPLKEARLSIKNEDGVNSLFSGITGGNEFGTKNQTDEQGRWTFKELPAGKYTLTVEPPPVYEVPDVQNPAKPKAKKLARWQREVVIEEGKEAEDLIVELGYGGTISGTISFDNRQDLPSSASITATDEKGKFSESAYIYTAHSNDGKPIPQKIDDFKIESIPNGKVFLKVSGARGYGESEGESFYVKSILLGGKDVNFSTLEVKEGEEIKGLQIVLSKDVGKLKGKVARADKSPVAGAKLFIVSTDRQRWANDAADLFAATNGDGEFETSGAPGEYFVIIRKDYEPGGDETAEQNPLEQRRARLEKESANAPKVTIKAKETETISLILP